MNPSPVSTALPRWAQLRPSLVALSDASEEATSALQDAERFVRSDAARASGRTFSFTSRGERDAWESSIARASTLLHEVAEGARLVRGDLADPWPTQVEQRLADVVGSRLPAMTSSLDGYTTVEGFRRPKAIYPTGTYERATAVPDPAELRTLTESIRSIQDLERSSADLAVAADAYRGRALDLAQGVTVHATLHDLHRLDVLAAGWDAALLERTTSLVPAIWENRSTPGMSLDLQADLAQRAANHIGPVGSNRRSIAWLDVDRVRDAAALVSSLPGDTRSLRDALAAAELVAMRDQGKETSASGLAAAVARVASELSTHGSSVPSLRDAIRALPEATAELSPAERFAERARLAASG